MLEELISNKNKERKYYFYILIALVAYYIASTYFPFDALTKYVTTTTTLIAAVTVWLNLRRAERLNESNYIKDLNNQFITNKDMSHIEHELELFYNQYESLLKGKKKQAMKENKNNVEKIQITDEELQTIHLGLNQSRTSDDCQKLINYLVYLESLAAIVHQHIIHLDVIDDLFSYRFFVAVNNPVVQQNELLPYKDFYRGIFSLSKEWTESHKKKKIPIPMEQYSLPDFKDDWSPDKGRIHLDIDLARGDDKKIDIARCIYQTDRFIYPEAFGDDEEKAANAIKRIIGMDGSLLDYKNLFVARFNGQVCGICLTSDGKSQWDTNAIKKRIGTDLLPERILEGFDHASKEYFSPFYKDSSDDKEIEIVAFSVDGGFRRNQVGSQLLAKVIEKYKTKTINLTVLADNTAARNLYEKFNFFYLTTEPEKEGFAPQGLSKPEIFRMRLSPKPKTNEAKVPAQ